MKLPGLLLLFAVLFFAACNSNSSKNEGETAISQQKTALLAFTDTVKQDTFKVSLKGNKLNEMVLMFTITTPNGEQIYRREITSKALLTNYLTKNNSKSEADQIKFLKDQVNYFFDEEHYLVPAITEQEQADKNAPDKTFYVALKKSQLNGFSYLVGNETKEYIGWSPEEKKVKIYYICCQPTK